MSRNLDTKAPVWRPGAKPKLAREPVSVTSTVSGAQFVTVASRGCLRCGVISFSGFCPFCTGRVPNQEAA